jgi:hypothetical protein
MSPIHAPESGYLLGIVLWSSGASIPATITFQAVSLGYCIPSLAGLLLGIGFLISRLEEVQVHEWIR